MFCAVSFIQLISCTKATKTLQKREYAVHSNGNSVFLQSGSSAVMSCHWSRSAALLFLVDIKLPLMKLNTSGTYFPLKVFQHSLYWYWPLKWKMPSVPSVLPTLGHWVFFAFCPGQAGFKHMSKSKIVCHSVFFMLAMGHAKVSVTVYQVAFIQLFKPLIIKCKGKWTCPQNVYYSCPIKNKMVLL